MLNSLKIKNYKCFKQTENIKFGANWSVIVGKNNSGKSALLKICNFTKEGSVPYRGQNSNIGFPLDPTTEIEFDIGIHGNDLKRVMLQTGSELLWNRAGPGFSNASPIENQIKDQFEELISIGQARLTGRLLLSQQIVAPVMLDQNQVKVYPSDNCSKIIPLPASQSFRVLEGNAGRNDNLFHNFVANYWNQAIYVFNAERLYIGASVVTDNLTLESNAANLAQVVQRLKQQRVRFDEYVDAVREVIPEITDIVPSATSQQGSTEIKISLVDRSLNREDLHFSLQECGTGVSQVLAILFVAISSNFPRIIVIDEPNSFLHPGAAKQLVRVLWKYPQHQYIISTHSSEIIQEVDPDQIILVQWTPDGSQVTGLEKDKFQHLQLILSEVGSRFSDLFGPDAIIWVEGPTEVECFGRILRNFNLALARGVKLVPMLTPDEWTGKKKEKFFEMVANLSNTISIAPKILAYCRDREIFTDAEVANSISQSDGRMRFLRRRQYENYLLVPQAIAALLGEIGVITSEADISNWIAKNGGDQKYGRFPNWSGATDDVNWLRQVNANKLLRDLFASLPETPQEYRKVEYGTRLTEWLLLNDPDYLSEVSSFVAELCELSA